MTVERSLCDTEGEPEECGSISELKLRISDLELNNNELLDKIDLNKKKARNLLMQRDLNENRLKLILVKLESYLKTKYKLS